MNLSANLTHFNLTCCSERVRYSELSALLQLLSYLSTSLN